MSEGYVIGQQKDAAIANMDLQSDDEEVRTDDTSRDEQDILDEAKKRYKEADDAWDHVYEAALDDLRFARLSEQWPEDVARDRRLNGRVVLTINKLPAFIRQVVNDARQNKPTIRVRPVDNSSDPNTADVFNGIIRHIEAISDADIAYDTSIDNSVTGGIGFFYIDIDYATDTGFEKEIYIRRVGNPQSVRFDAASTAADSSDWRYAFLTEMVSKDEFKRRFPGAEFTDWDGADADNMGWFTQDEVRIAIYWCKEESAREIVQLSNGEVVDAEEYDEQPELWGAAGITETARRTVRETKVIRRAMSGAEVLEETEWAGKYIPVVPVFGEEVNEDGKRIFQSLIRHAKDSQRQFNYMRSMTTELLALAPKAPYIGSEDAFEVEGEAEKWATANTQSHPYLRYKKGSQPPIRQEFAGVPTGAVQEASNAADDLKTVIGIHDANMGVPGQEVSGIALLARQREGDVGSFHFIDNLTRAIRCAGKILVDLIPHIYTGKRMVRILGEDKKPIIVALGTRQSGSAPPGPVMQQQPQASAAVAQINGLLQQHAQAQGMPQAPQINLPPDLMATLDGMQHVYDLGVGQYDVECIAGPSFTSRRQETAEAVFALIQAYPAGAPALADILLSNLDFPDAEKIAQRMQALQQQQNAQQGQGAQGAPDVVGAAKVQADAKIQANRETLAADRQMNLDKLANDRQMKMDQMSFEANQNAQDHAAGQAETHSKNATSVLTTAMRTHAQQPKAPVIGAIQPVHTAHNPLNPGI